MTDITIRGSSRLPIPRKLVEFFQLQVNRLLVGAYRYQTGIIGGQAGYDYLKRLQRSIRNYRRSGNLECLVDAANYCWLEYQAPSHPKAHFVSQDSNGRNNDEAVL